MSKHERMPVGADLGTVMVCTGAAVCDYCEAPAVLQFRFRKPLGEPSVQAGCREHAGVAGMGAAVASVA